MSGRSLLCCAYLAVLFCCPPSLVSAANPVKIEAVPAITWMQVVSENQFALPPGHRFIPLGIKRWAVSSTNRLRIEEGNHVFICDCQTGETLLLDLQGKTARKQEEDPKPNIYQQLRKPLFERGVAIQGQSRILGRAATICAWQHKPSSLIWCDSETGDVLYGEDWSTVDGREQGISQVSFNFNYAASLDRSLFSLEPPPGFTLIR